MVPLKPFAVPYVVVPRECRVQFPKPCFKGLKWGRWDCNVRGGAAESSVIRIACDLWVVRRVDRTPVFGRRPKDAAYHTWGCVRLVRVRFAALLDEAVVARVGNQHRCSVRMVSDWGWRCWLGCGRKSPAMMGLWCVSWLVAWV